MIKTEINVDDFFEFYNFSSLDEFPYLDEGETTTSDALEALQNVKSLRKKRMDRTLSNNNGLISTTITSPADYVLHNNNNNVKNERLSPSIPDTSTRSRSVTPSSGSHPGTPPAAAVPLENPLISGRNYSDFMRSLAAKYNHTNPNDYFAAIRNGFPSPLDPRFKPATAPIGFPPSLLPGFSVTSSKEPPVANLNSKKPPPVAPDFASVLSPFAGASTTMFPPLIDMSTTQTLLAMVRTAKEAELQGLLKNVKRQDSSTPLDLSSGAPPAKRQRIKTPSVGSPSQLSTTPTNLQQPKRAESESPKLHEDISNWSVDDVCNFVQNIDICAEYAQTFRDQCIDGSGLPLLTEDHLTNRMGMKLGPALKLRSILAKKLGSCSVCLHCSHCHTTGNTAQSPDPGNNTGNLSDSGGAS